MTGPSSPRDAGAWQFRGLYLLALAALLVVGALLASDLSAGVRRGISGVGILSGGLLVAATCRYWYRRSTNPRRRHAWMLFMAAALVAAASNLWLLLAGVVEGRYRVAAPDVLLLLALGLGVAGVITYPSTPSRRADLARMVLDGVVIGGTVLFVASLRWFPQMLPDDPQLLSRMAPLLAPIFDTVVATVAALLFLRGGRADRPALGLASLGFSLYAVSDFGFALITARGPFSFGTPIDLGWIAGYVCLALAIRTSTRTPSPSEAPRELSPVLGTVFMFGLFFLAAIISLSALRTERINTAASVLWIVVLLAVVARQLFLIIDNETLRRTLERRVDERTRTLRTVTQRSDLVVNSVGDGIYGVDQSGVLTYINPAGAKALGYAAEDLIGRDAHATFHAVRPDGLPYPMESCYITEAIAQRTGTSAEDDTYTRADGFMIPVEVTATPLIEDGAVQGAVVVFRDVTQRREVDRMKTEFVSMVSHELRTPLTSIRGSLGLLAGGALGPLAPRATRMVEIALDSSDRLGRLVNDILDIERIESGAIAMRPGSHPAVRLVENAVAQVQLLAAEADVQITAASLPGRVYADADRVVQTLINLLGNAIKFSPPGGTIEVSSSDRGSYIEFCITDHGRGIPDDKLESVFGRFEQVDTSDARLRGGFGLGLAISRSLVERQGGRIWAEHNPGGGTIFRFTLPQAADAVPAAVPPAHTDTARTPAPDSPVSVQPVSVQPVSVEPVPVEPVFVDPVSVRPASTHSAPTHSAPASARMSQPSSDDRESEQDQVPPGRPISRDGVNSPVRI